jgi:hypothetical protein
MRMTSLCHCKNSNYQIDHTNIADFERWCIKNEVIWAHLFNEETGQPVASFFQGKIRITRG